MKRAITPILLFLLSTFSFAQTVNEKCGFDAIHQTLAKADATYREAVEKNERIIQQILNREQENPQLRTQATLYTIPVVVHVMHRGSAVGSNENISDAQVRSAIKALNDDYRHKPGTAGYGNGVDLEVEFCLASKDPNGNAHTGINRVNANDVTDFQTKGITTGGNETQVKAKSKWANDRYYNIWIVPEINDNEGGAGVQGYAYFPGASANVDGAVILYNAFGIEGNLKSYTDRNSVATHEIGHGFNLYHTFEGSNGSTCPPEENGCGSGKGDCISDIPPHKTTNSTCPADNTVNSCKAGSTAKDYVHNYMDYSSEDCVNMFTQGQADRLRATLKPAGSNPILDPAGPRASLATASNVSACGCDGTNKPSAEFSVSATTPCIGVSVKFTDESLYSPTSWQWTFEGGTPPSSTEQNPVVTFNSSGPYDVTLVATNTNGSSTPTTKTDYIKPRNAATLPVSADFAGVQFPPTGFSRTEVVSQNDTLWSRATVSANGEGSGSAVIKNDEVTGAITPNALILPPMTFVGTDNPQLTFDVAYERYYFDPTDSLVVFYSTDCGQTFYPSSYKKGYNNLYTSHGSSYKTFVPTASQWRKETVDLTELAGEASVVIKIERRQPSNGASNYLYIDNILVDNAKLAPVADFEAWPRVICKGDSVQFTDKSEYEPASWEWTFENGEPSTSTEQNPKVAFNAPGKHTVTLKATNEAGEDAVTKSDYIEVLNTDADFSADRTSVLVNQLIVFSNTGSQNNDYTWYFGDGTTSAAFEPTHKYTAASKYDVSLLIANQTCIDSVVKQEYIEVKNPTGIGEKDSGLLRIYPNPSNGKLIIEKDPSSSITELKVMDITGRVVINIQAVLSENRIQLDMSSLAKGMYILKATVNGRNFVQPIQLTE